MHSAVLLSNENNNLRAANQKQKHKREREQLRSYVSSESALTGEEGIKRAKNAKICTEVASTVRPCPYVLLLFFYPNKDFWEGV